VLKLYYIPQTRATRPRWLLEELEVPYELVRLDYKADEHKGEAYRKVNPLGTVPALDDDGQVMIESSAICLYLADKYSEKGLAPARGTPDRMLYDQWMVFSTTTLEVPILRTYEHTHALPPEARSEKVVQESQELFNKYADLLTEQLGENEFLVANRFSAADVMIGQVLIWARFMGLLKGHKVLDAYAKRLAARPANKVARGD
jgi:glutathione S-transferase